MKLLLLSHHAISCWRGLHAFFPPSASDGKFASGVILKVTCPAPNQVSPDCFAYQAKDAKEGTVVKHSLGNFGRWHRIRKQICSCFFWTSDFNRTPVFFHHRSTEDDPKRRQNPTGWHASQSKACPPNLHWARGLLARLTDTLNLAGYFQFEFRYHIGVHSLEERFPSITCSSPFQTIPKQRNDEVKTYYISVILLSPTTSLEYCLSFMLFSRIRHSQSLPSSGAKAQQKTRRGRRGFTAKAEKHLRPAAADTDQGKDWPGMFRDLAKKAQKALAPVWVQK